MSRETWEPGEEGPDLGGFQFNLPPRDFVTPRELALERLGDPRVFDISPDGTIRAHGYSVSEVAQLLQDYRENMFKFAEGMQRLGRAVEEAMSAQDAVRYRPEEGSDHP